MPRKNYHHRAAAKTPAALVLLALFLARQPAADAWGPRSPLASSHRHQQQTTSTQQRQQQLQCRWGRGSAQLVPLFAAGDQQGGGGGDGDDAAEDAARTSFDQASKSMIDEEDRQRMEQMGDFDSNPDYKMDNIERMREAIKARTADLGIEKSKVTAEYIQAKQDAAMQSGPGGGADPDQFGGLDLSKISSAPAKKGSDWNEEMPSMFYDPEDELTKEEQEEVDPIMKKNPFEQGLHEFNNAKWPTFGAALKEVGLLLVIVAISTVLIVGFDTLVRELYTTVGFIPTKEDLMNYASRFDGLDLPKGWTDNMNEQDIAQFTETVNAADPAAAAAAAASGSMLPEL